MSITETVSYDKDGRMVKFPLLRKLFVPLVIVLVAGLSFGIGRLTVVGKREAVRIEYDKSLMSDDQTPISNQVPNPNVLKTQTANVIQAVTPASQQVIASKNGSRYHYLHCSGAKQIKEENRITFASPAEAESAGYTLAANCKPR